MKSNCKYKNIIFDLFDVSVKIDWKSVVLKVLENDDRLADFVWQFFRSEHWLDYKKGKIEPEDFQLILPHTVPYDKFKNLLFQMPEYVEPITEMVEVAESIKKRGFRLYLLTNVTKSTFTVLKKRFPFFNLFDGIVTSFQACSVKPEPQIYMNLLKKYNLEPSECFFVDDMDCNIQKAKSLGIDGFVYANHNELTNALKAVNIL